MNEFISGEKIDIENIYIVHDPPGPSKTILSVHGSNPGKKKKKGKSKDRTKRCKIRLIDS